MLKGFGGKIAKVTLQTDTEINLKDPVTREKVFEGLSIGGSFYAGAWGIITYIRRRFKVKAIETGIGTPSISIGVDKSFNVSK